MEPSFDIDQIVLKYIREESLTPEESFQLRRWLAASEERENLLHRLRRDPAWVQANLARMQHYSTDPIWLQVETRLKSDGYWLPADTNTASSSSTLVAVRRHTGRRYWRVFFVAASVILILSAGGAWLWSLSHHATTLAPTAPLVATDVQPGGNKAILTLADGRQINLDSSANGVLAAQGNAQISKLSAGQLAYNKGRGAAAATAGSLPLLYNSLSTPRAGQFTLTLPDGTHVWLNNASTLRYPVAFTGADRPVELTGEAYFEVAKDAAHPFRVIVHRANTPAPGSATGPATDEGGSIEVLGTSFNVMAYADEPAERTTLVDGSIRFSPRAGSSVLLHPAQQSVLDDKGALHVLPHVNVDEVTAWKNGYFHFDHASLQTTMRQLARWYDVDVTYQGQPAEQQFMGKIQRDLPLSAVLKGLENENVHFKLQGRELTVTP
jgi:ferric-dicitrate binding protein FerR (iron transport regulator)